MQDASLGSLLPTCPPSPRCMAGIRGVRGSNLLQNLLTISWILNTSTVAAKHTLPTPIPSGRLSGSSPKYQQCAKGPLVEHQQHPCSKCQEQPNHHSNALEASMKMVSFRRFIVREGKMLVSWFYGLPRNKFEASFFPPMKMVVTGASKGAVKIQSKTPRDTGDSNTTTSQGSRPRFFR